MTKGSEPPPPRISDRVLKKMYETIDVSPVTIIVGPTGCGKSTQVPPSLLIPYRDRRIVCTQPRRLAVVTVATRVAQERGVTLGGEDVGYHVGQSNHSLSTTKLLFVTAGILLEELRAEGVDALTKYKVVIIDECHERSPESDLLLGLVRSMLIANPNKGIRIVLMSATFDHARYQRYFGAVPGCSRIETITLETASSFNMFYERVNTFYIDDIVPILPPSDEHRAHLRAMIKNPNHDLAGNDNGKSLTPGLLHIIVDLLVHHHRKEPIDGVFLLFAPTYRHLEQIYEHLRCGSLVDDWRVGVLHSSVDMEYCLRSMRPDISSGSATVRRKILLASAIADSSVTIPGVTIVVDLCRSLEVKWSAENQMHIAKTVWSSRSICDQRSGRTGRTCSGKVFRMVPKGFFISKLESWEKAQLTLSSCRDELLKIICTSSVRDPSDFLGHCLDAPPPTVVRDALQYLKTIGACYEGKKRVLPTKSGELMALLPFHVDDSRAILAGGRLGLMHETLTLQAIRSHKPAPIAHHFGDNAKNEANAIQFLGDIQVNDPASMEIANLSAFLFWDAQWNASRTRATIEQFAHATGCRSYLPDSLHQFLNGLSDSRKACCDVWRWTPELEEKHVQFCETHAINPTSVRAIADLIDSTWHVFYLSNFEPEWLRCTHPSPLWRCHDRWTNKGGAFGKEMLNNVYGPTKTEHLKKALASLSTNQMDIASQHATTFLDFSKSAPSESMHSETPVACIHFLRGNCVYGSRCRHSHSPSAMPPLCKYFLSGRCSKGPECAYSHGVDLTRALKTTAIDTDFLSPMLPLLPSLALNGGSLKWFSDHRRKLLLLGEGNFEFARSLIQLRLRPAFASSLESDVYRIGHTDILNVDATRMHQNEELIELISEGRLENFSWNFPYTGIEENMEVHESLILGTFLSLNCLLIGTAGPENRFQMAFTLQGDQFSRWMVMRSAVRAGWHLERWGAFQSSDYPGYKPRRANGETFPESSSRFYVFARGS